MSNKVYMTPNAPTPNKGQRFDAEKCNGCNACVEVCPTDVMMPNPEKKRCPSSFTRRNAGSAAPASKSARGGHLDDPSREPEHLGQLEAQGDGGVFPAGDEEPAAAEHEAALRRERREEVKGARENQ